MRYARTSDAHPIVTVVAVLHQLGIANDNLRRYAKQTHCSNRIDNFVKEETTSKADCRGDYRPRTLVQRQSSDGTFSLLCD